MIKRIGAYCAAALALSTLAAGPAQATTDGPAFSITFYSDNTYSDVVGFARPNCYPDPHATLQWGHSTDYQEVNYEGQCVDGQYVIG
jgi:hypothetical protein